MMRALASANSHQKNEKRKRESSLPIFPGGVSDAAGFHFPGSWSQSVKRKYACFTANKTGMEMNALRLFCPESPAHAMNENDRCMPYHASESDNTRELSLSSNKC